MTSDREGKLGECDALEAKSFWKKQHGGGSDECACAATWRSLVTSTRYSRGGRVLIRVL